MLFVLGVNLLKVDITKVFFEHIFMAAISACLLLFVVGNVDTFAHSLVICYRKYFYLISIAGRHKFKLFMSSND